MSVTPPPTPAERFAQIIAMMVRMIGARLERPGKPGLAGPLTLAIHIRLQRIRNRLTRYVARWQAGTLTPPRQRPAVPRRRSRAPGQWDHLPKLPRGRMWLVRLVPGIGVGASHLSILLDDPDMAAMLQAAPQIGRTLRPFWHMLSADPLPPSLQRPPPPDPPPTPRSTAAHRAPPPAPPRAEAFASRQTPPGAPGVAPSGNILPAPG